MLCYRIRKEYTRYSIYGKYDIEENNRYLSNLALVQQILDQAVLATVQTKGDLVADQVG